MVFANQNDLLKNQNEQLRSKDYWKNFAPDLHIEDEQFLSTTELLDLDSEKLQECINRVGTEGYSQIIQAFDPELTKKVLNLIERLVASNVLPVFCLLYDEIWQMQMILQPVIKAVLGDDYLVRPCFWAWHLDPLKEESGWRPHRDGPVRSLTEDLKPNVLSLWIALSDATINNGCMYVQPMNWSKKPGEIEPKELDINPPNARALPAKAGDALIWNHWVIHWGSRANKRAENTRVSMAFELEKVGLKITKLPLIEPISILDFEKRLKIVALQIRQYTHMYQFTDEMMSFVESVLGKQAVQGLPPSPNQ